MAEEKFDPVAKIQMMMDMPVPTDADGDL